MMREGIQESEARNFIERALTDDALRERLGEELATKSREILDERTQFIRQGISTWGASAEYPRLGVNSNSWWGLPGILGAHWYIGSGWEDRAKALFDAAAEVAQKL